MGNQNQILFAFAKGTSQSDLETLKLQITPAVYDIALSKQISTYTAEELAPIDNPMNIVDAKNLVNLDKFFSGINQAIRENKVKLAPNLIMVDSHEGNEYLIKIILCLAIEATFMDHQFFYKSYIQTTPFKVVKDQDSGAALIESDDLNNISIEEVLVPELYAINPKNEVIHPEELFGMRRFGKVHPNFNLKSENLQNAAKQVVINDRALWVGLVQHFTPEFLKQFKLP